MAPNVSQLFSRVFLLLIVLSILSHANSDVPTGKKPSLPFEFIKHLQGCHKGDKVKGLYHLKKYLKEFGYINNLPNSNSHANDDDFDDLLESAIKTYQTNHLLNSTGFLDAETVSEMMRPRCGVPDIINGHNWMHPTRKSHPRVHRRLKSFHAVSHYAFIEGNPRWPATRTSLTYGFAPNTPTVAISAVARAFGTWASVTHFQFSQTASYESADIKIGFFGGDHGDGGAFDGPGGTIAHAFPPTDGRFHYDADEQWSIGPISGALDLETVALHEIGHLLGLGHSSVPDAIMWPGINSGATKGLHDDDIQGIRALYNF